MRLAVLDLDLEQRIVVSLTIGQFMRNGGELLVGRIIRRRNIVRQQDGVSTDVTELDDVAVLDTVALPVGFRIGNRRQNLPVIVRVVEWVSCDLLALAGNTAVIIAEGILLPVAVKKHLGVLVPDSDCVIVLNADRLRRHEVVTEGFLELRGHEIIAWPGAGENGEMDLEPEQVKEERHNDEGKCAGSKVLSPMGHAESSRWAVDIQQVPQVNQNRSTNGDKCENTDILRRDNAAETNARQEQPLPPFTAKGFMTQLVEANVAQDA